MMLNNPLRQRKSNPMKTVTTIMILCALTGTATASTAYYEGHMITVTQTDKDHWMMTVLRYENRATEEYPAIIDTTETHGILKMVTALCALRPDFGDDDCIPSAFLFICADFDVVGILLAHLIEIGA